MFTFAASMMSLQCIPPPKCRSTLPKVQHRFDDYSVMHTSRTRELFSPLIQKPPLTDQLLQRPPFKFLHDIVSETVRATGFLGEVFSRDELDPSKASASRDTKLAFLQKVVDILNVDGSLDDVKPAKIVAGKEPELTNLLLQKLATEAAVHLAAAKKASKHKSTRPRKTIKEGSEKKSSKEKTPTHQSPVVSSKDASEKIPSKKSRGLEASTTRSKSKIRKTTKEKLPSKKEESASIDRPISRIQKESRIDSPHAASSAESGRKSAGGPISARTLPDRESSGGTSKGGDDSGIADETGAESERHDSERITASTTSDAQRHDLIGTPSRRKSPEFFDIPPSTSSHTIQMVDIPKFARPTTAAGRPQTSLGRPGTTMTRAPPPKIKKTKVGEIDPLVVSSQPVTAGAAVLILEDKADNKERDMKAENDDQFLIEEDDEVLALEPSDSARAAALIATDEHGVLVNRIVENTRELEKHIQSKLDLSDGTDPHESRRIRIEIESVQKAIQTASQNLQPLGRSMEYVADEFDAMIKEIEDSRKATAKNLQMLQEAATDSGSNTFALASTLRNLDAEIKEDENVENTDETASMNRSVRLWQHIVDNLQTNNLFLILKYLINEHREKKETAVGLKTHFSIYRDILFVALDQFSRSVDREQFDRQYYQELKHLPPRILPLLPSEDFAPKPLVIACRRIFIPLDIR